MRRYLLATLTIMFFCICTLIPNANANTVTINIDGIDPFDIAAFQFFFNEPDGTYGWPVETDNTVFPPGKDFAVNIGPAIQYSDYWNVDTLLSADGAYDFARGVAGAANLINPANALVDETLLVMSSENTYFAINLRDDRNDIFEMGTDQSIIASLFVTEEWLGADQIVTISATDPGPGPVVPIPASVFLLGGGLLSLFGIRRRG